MYSALPLKRLVPEEEAGFLEQEGKALDTRHRDVAGLLPGTTGPGLYIWSSSVSPGLRLLGVDRRERENVSSAFQGRWVGLLEASIDDDVVWTRPRTCQPLALTGSAGEFAAQLLMAGLW